VLCVIIAKKKDPECSFYQFTSNLERRKCWLQLLEITETHILVYARDIYNSNDPQINLGKRFASPIKQKLPRAKRVKARNSRREASTINSTPNDVSLTAPIDTIPSQPSLTAATGEKFCTDYSDHELPNESGNRLSDVQSTSALPSDISSLFETVYTAESGINAEVLVNKALLARIEVIEAEN